LIHVVDASSVVAALIDDGATGRWCEARLSEADLAAPVLMPFEVANVIRRHELRGDLPASDAANALHDLRRLHIMLVPFDVVADRVWALRENLTVYDAAYAAVAEALDAKLVTLDARLATSPGLRCDVLVAP
jgi:predicted nucleic acid-binding protein